MKKIILIAAIIGLSNPCFAYNDYGYSYGVATPYSGGFNSSMHIREMENDFYRSQAANRASIDAVCTPRPTQQPRVTESTYSAPPISRNPDRDYVISKPLSLKGIGPYDAYGN